MSRVLKNGTNQITNSYANHTGWSKGVDVVKYKSQLEYIVAHSAGKVIKVVDYITGHESDREAMAYGNYVMILHDNNYVTLYAHLSASSVKVKEGDQVAKGAIIGFSGNTGNSFGGHLHFELRKYKGSPVAVTLHNVATFDWLDPTNYLDSDLPVDYVTHTVVRGDTFWGLASKYLGKGWRYTEIQKLNNKTSLYPGDRILIPIAKSPVVTYEDYKLLSLDYYRVRKSWSDKKSQLGAYKKYSGAVELAKKNPGYHVYDKDGKEIY